MEEVLRLVRAHILELEAGYTAEYNASCGEAKSVEERRRLANVRHVKILAMDDVYYFLYTLLTKA